MENKKTLILSIVGVLVLIIAVVGVSFAMYTFSAGGTRVNVIQTGTVSLDFNGAGTCSIPAHTTYDACEDAGGAWTNPNTITLTNEYPKTDDQGIKNTAVSFNVAARYTGSMTINYALQFVDIKEAANLKANMIKLQVKKTVGDDISYPMGSATTGALMSTVENTSNALTGVDGYVFDTGSFIASGTHTYELRAWVDENYNLTQGTNVGKCMNGAIEDTASNTADACATAGHTWVQTNASVSETITFKIRVVASQVDVQPQP